MSQDGPDVPHDGSKKAEGITPRCPRRIPREAQDGPKMCQDRPRLPQGWPKIAYDDSKLGQDKPRIT